MTSPASLRLSQLLALLSKSYGLTGIKTSFEDEGASYREVQSLKNIASLENLSIHLKTQGPDCRRDLADAQSLLITNIICPLVESAFGARKFLEAFQQVVPSSSQKLWKLGLNIESIGGLSAAHLILKQTHQTNISSITFGRVDFCHSLGLNRRQVDSPEVFSHAHSLLRQAKTYGKRTFLGGALTYDSHEFVSKLFADGLLDYYETRYCIFDASDSMSNFSDSIRLSHEVEALILQVRLEEISTKQEIYGNRLKLVSTRF